MMSRGIKFTNIRQCVEALIPRIASPRDDGRPNSNYAWAHRDEIVEFYFHDASYLNMNVDAPLDEGRNTENALPDAER
jgi:hypothetical protein